QGPDGAQGRARPRAVADGVALPRPRRTRDPGGDLRAERRPRRRQARSRRLMSGQAVPRESIGPVAPPRLLARAWRLVADESLLVLCTAIFAIAFVLRLSGQVNQDAWLGLAGGRTVV